MLGGYKVNYQGKEVQLVRLRNPWGKCEVLYIHLIYWNYKHQWKGVFGDDWAGWSDHGLRAQVPYEKKDDGIFFMTYQDF